MIYVVWFIVALGSAVASALPAAAGEVTAGRAAFLAAKVRWRAGAELALLVDGPWVDSALAASARRWVDLGGTLGADWRVARWMEAVPGLDDVRVLGVEVDLLDRAGRVRAANSVGKVVQFSVSPADTSIRVWSLSRGVLRGTQ